MFGILKAPKTNAAALLKALDRSLAIIEFSPTGKILSANATFCAALGYDRAEIVGQHHSLFVDPAYAKTDAYRSFWAKLGRGEFDAREYKRVGKGGREVWIQASYNPVLTSRGRVLKVVKVATDITAEKLKNAEYQGKIDAIARTQAVIEFTKDGHILTANQLFLDAVGYTLEEIKGRHHRMFVRTEHANSAEYKLFWDKLNRGEFLAADFLRVGKNGQEIWLHASYNPIFDADGRVIKIVKFATNATGRVHAVNALGKGLAELAANDLTGRIEVPFDPQYERLRTDYNDAIAQLAELVSGIVANTDGIRSGTGEIAQASDDLSRRTEQQAASLEQTAAALEQITTTVRRTAEGAKQAGEAVGKARADADRSGVIVQDAVTAMGEIERSAQQISQIIGVIDEIAFQTNLLALNAGVEAARAGDAGRGFAVVASEVRALAQRSAEAAKEIKGLISTSTQQVARGVELVGETGRSLGRIVEQVGGISNVVTEIAHSALEQSTGLAEVNTAVNQMDKVTQQNAAMVEESTAASHALAQETENLANLTSRFQLASATVRPAARPQAAPAPRHEVRAPAKSTTRARPALKIVTQSHKPQQAESWEEF